MADYIKDLEAFEKAIVDILASAEATEMYLSKLTEKLEKSGTSGDKTTLRDAIIALAVKKKIKIEKRAPKQLIVQLAEKK